MVGKAINWIKQHKLITLLLVIIFFLLKPLNILYYFFGSMNSYDSSINMQKSRSFMNVASPSMGIGSAGITFEENQMIPDMAPPVSIVQPEPAPVITTTRKIIANANLSLMVKSVSDSLKRFKQEAEQLGGYVISSNINRSDYGESANMEIRVPSEKLDDALAFLRENSIKVVSENQSGNDITDSYSDIQAKITILERNKAQFEAMMDKAVTIEEILNVQSHIMNLQDQIDSFKGKLNYLDGASRTSKISVYLSTDEIALPYAPNEPWRPEVVFKHAVRSLVGNLQKLGTFGIWALVYSPFIVAVLWVFFLVRRFRRKPQA